MHWLQEVAPAIDCFPLSFEEGGVHVLQGSTPNNYKINGTLLIQISWLKPDLWILEVLARILNVSKFVVYLFYC